MPRFMLQRLILGLLLCFAGWSCVPRCTKLPPYLQCKVRMRHYHQGVEYRGVPVYEKQHLQYGQKYKQQRKDDHQQINTPKHRKRKERRRVTIRHGLGGPGG
jgi:hypothetical protein